MPKYSDDIYLGTAKILIPPDPANPTPSPISEGVGPLGRIYVFDAVPLAPQSNNIVSNQSPAGPGTLPLNVAGVGITVRVGPDNAPMIVLDTPRAVTIGATTGGAPFVVSGYDQYGQPMSESFAAVGTGKKAFKIISKITVGAAGTVINVGASSMIGLPFRIADLGYLVSLYWAGAVLTPTAVVLADGTAATPTTGDVRGTVGVTAPDGIKRLVMVQAMAGIQVGPNATRVGAVGVPQA